MRCIVIRRCECTAFVCSTKSFAVHHLRLWDNGKVAFRMPHQVTWSGGAGRRRRRGLCREGGACGGLMERFVCGTESLGLEAFGHLFLAATMFAL
jgi:hypothetical protein